MTKARTLGNFVSTGNPLSDGTIAASELTGTLAVANGGTGQTTYTDGQVLIGNTTGNTLTKASLTAGTGITITPGAGSISIAANNAGTVTSVTGTSPVASSGGATPAISLTSGYGDTLNPYASKTANFVLAAPNGSAGVPTFRAVDAADIPTLNQNTTGNAATATSATTSTNIAGGSNGTIPYQSASGTTQMLAVGTAGQVLQTNGAAAPTWVTPSSGAMVLLNTQTASSTNGVNIDFISSTYTNYMLVIEGLYHSTGGNGQPHMRYRCSGTTDTNGAYGFTHTQSTGSAWSGSSSVNDSYIGLANTFMNGTNASTSYFCVVNITTVYNNSGNNYLVKANSHLQNPTGGRGATYPNLVYSTYQGSSGLNSTVTGIRVYLNVNEPMTGKISLYGLT